MLMDSFVKKAFHLFTVHHYSISPVRQKNPAVKIWIYMLIATVTAQKQTEPINTQNMLAVSPCHYCNHEKYSSCNLHHWSISVSKLHRRAASEQELTRAKQATTFYDRKHSGIFMLRSVLIILMRFRLNTTEHFRISRPVGFLSRTLDSVQTWSTPREIQKPYRNSSAKNLNENERLGWVCF